MQLKNLVLFSFIGSTQFVHISATYDTCEWYDLNGCCEESKCPESYTGDGDCDPRCLSRDCDWDGGDCDSLSPEEFERLSYQDRSRLCNLKENGIVKGILSFVGMFSGGAKSAGEKILNAGCDFLSQHRRADDTEELIAEVEEIFVTKGCYNITYNNKTKQVVEKVGVCVTEVLQDYVEGQLKRLSKLKEEDRQGIDFEELTNIFLDLKVEEFDIFQRCDAIDGQLKDDLKSCVEETFVAYIVHHDDHDDNVNDNGSENSKVQDLELDLEEKNSKELVKTGKKKAGDVDTTNINEKS